MKFYIVIILYSVLFILSPGCQTHIKRVGQGERSSFFFLPKGFKYPNGLTHNSEGELFVGSVVSGNILKIDKKGKSRLFHKNSDTVFAGTSLRLDEKKNVLWVASPDFLGQEVDGKTVKRPHRIAALDATSGKELWSAAVPDAGFVNDFVFDNEGGVFLTDSLRDLVYHLKRPGADFEVVSKSSKFSPGQLGPAGIANFDNKKLIVGLYNDGRLVEVKLNDSKKAERVRYLSLERRIENPDGLLALKNNQLLILEGASVNGDGKILQVDLNSSKPYKLKVLMSGIKSPLNLTKIKNDIFVSEGNIRHLIIKDNQIEIPEYFKIIKLPYDKKNTFHTPKGFYPESIVADKSGYLYLGSAVSSEVYRFNKNSGENSKFIDGKKYDLMSIQGMYVSEPEKRLYLCTADLGFHESLKNSPSRLVAFKLQTGELINSWNMPMNGLCNDLTAFVKNTLLISDTNNDHVLIFNPTGKGKLRIWLKNPMLGGAKYNGNGIVWNKKRNAVYLTTFQNGELFKIGTNSDGSPGVVEKVKLSRKLDGADALRLYRNKLLVFENGLSNATKGSVSFYDFESKTLDRLEVNVTAPTSGVVVGRTLFVVDSFFNDLFSVERTKKKLKSKIYKVDIPSNF